MARPPKGIKNDGFRRTVSHGKGCWLFLMQFVPVAEVRSLKPKSAFVDCMTASHVQFVMITVHSKISITQTVGQSPNAVLYGEGCGPVMYLSIKRIGLTACPESRLHVSA